MHIKWQMYQWCEMKRRYLNEYRKRNYATVTTSTHCEFHNDHLFHLWQLSQTPPFHYSPHCKLDNLFALQCDADCIPKLYHRQLWESFVWLIHIFNTTYALTHLGPSIIESEGRRLANGHINSTWKFWPYHLLLFLNLCMLPLSVIPLLNSSNLL